MPSGYITEEGFIPYEGPETGVTPITPEPEPEPEPEPDPE